MPYGMGVLQVKIGPGNGLLPDGTKPFPNPVEHFAIFKNNIVTMNIKKMFENYHLIMTIIIPRGQWVDFPSKSGHR